MKGGGGGGINVGSGCYKMKALDKPGIMMQMGHLDKQNKKIIGI